MGDKCPLCGCDWHGLMCGATLKQELDSNYRMSVTQKCKCPGPYGLPVMDEGPRTESTKGKW